MPDPSGNGSQSGLESTGPDSDVSDRLALAGLSDDTECSGSQTSRAA